MEDFSWQCRSKESCHLIQLSQDAAARIGSCNVSQTVAHSDESLTSEVDPNSSLQVLIDDSSYLQGEDWDLLQHIVRDLIWQATKFDIRIQVSFLNQTQHLVSEADIHWSQHKFSTITPHGPKPIGNGLERVLGIGGYSYNLGRNALFVTASDPDEDYDHIEREITSFLQKNAKCDLQPGRVGILQIGGDLQATVFWRRLDKAIRSTLEPLGTSDLWAFQRLRNRAECSRTLEMMLSSLMKVDLIRTPGSAMTTALQPNTSRAARIRRLQTPPTLDTSIPRTTSRNDEGEYTVPMQHQQARDDQSVSQTQIHYIENSEVLSTQFGQSDQNNGYGDSFRPLEITEPIPESTQNLVSHLLRYRFCSIINFIYYSILFASFVLGLSWTIVKSDVQGGFTLAAYVAMVASGIILPIQNRHSRGCKCFERQISYVIHI